MISSRSPCRAAPIVPNSAPVVQIASAQPSRIASVSSGRALGGEVEIVAELAEQGVAHRAADEVQFVAGGGEAHTDFVGDRGDAHQLRDGAALRGGQRVGGCLSGMASVSVSVPGI